MQDQAAPKPVIMTTSTKDVIETLLSSDEPLWGKEIATRADLPWKTAHLVLNRLQDANWLTSSRENVGEGSARRGDHGIRRYWELTPAGKDFAIQQLAARHRRLAPKSRSEGGIGL
jgi:predicted transcriptional regulator